MAIGTYSHRGMHAQVRMAFVITRILHRQRFKDTPRMGIFGPSAQRRRAKNITSATLQLQNHLLGWKTKSIRLGNSCQTDGLAAKQIPSVLTSAYLQQQRRGHGLAKTILTTAFR